MRGVNKHIVVGTVGQDPDIKYAANGNAIANLSLAVNEEWLDKNTGQKQQRTDWIRVVIFGKLAEICAQYVKKGSQLYVEGKVKTRSWDDPSTGEKKYSTETVVDIGGTMQMLGGGNGGGQQKSDQQAQAYGAQYGQNGGNYQQNSAQQQQNPNINPQTGQAYTPQEMQQQGTNNQLNQQHYPANDFDDDDVPF